MAAEFSLAICVMQTNRRYVNDRVERKPDETVEAFAERVKQRLIELHTKPNS